MLFFLYLSGILAMLLGVTLFQRQSKKIRNKNYSDELILRYFAKKAIENIMIMCLVVIIVSLLLPLLIWTLSPKEVGVVDKIIETNTLSPISSYNKNQYIKEVTDTGVKSYIVNVGESSKDIQYDEGKLISNKIKLFVPDK
ncbi:hypothetical protein [Clostridium ljungdahlii]|uniref:Uncharacterized protein n=1 Tax=Clostridium ljungdahlii TaxID=1538 RepID=A0A166S8V1_9CLOT|nr:hypothetical protein [Clostridium ljungdahlii]OAA91821.1 hypothetical protein WY13_00465 [Clostridium ljungdahlii]